MGRGAERDEPRKVRRLRRRLHRVERVVFGREERLGVDFVQAQLVQGVEALGDLAAAAEAAHSAGRLEGVHDGDGLLLRGVVLELVCGEEGLELREAVVP